MTSIAASLAFLVTVVFMLALRPVAHAIKLVDVPGGRKRHEDQVPVIGGLAMAIGLAFGASLALQHSLWMPTAFGIYLLVVVGVIDDRFDLPASVRLIAQTSASLIVMFGAGAIVSHLGSPFFFDLPLGPLALPFSLLFILTVINAFNVIDGLDGLAGGLSCVALGALAAVSGGTDIFTLVVVLAAVVAGFLLFNLPFGFSRKARCFMGDAGSTFLGLSIAAVGIILSQGPEAAITPAIGLWFIAVPAFDLFCAIIRRLVKRESPFAPDHDHLHHILNANGRSRRGGALLVMLAMAVIGAVIGIAGHMLGVADGVMTLLWLAVGVGYYRLMRRPGFLLKLIRAPEEIIAQRRERAA